MKIFKYIYKFKYYILIFLIIEFAFIFIISSNKFGKEDRYKDRMINQLHSEYLSTVDKYELVAKSIFNREVNKSDILKIVKKANFVSESEKEILRKELFFKLNDSYLYLKDLGFNIFHFHLPNGESFCRFHQIDKFGDNLFSKRYSIKLISNKKSYLYGYEEGKVDGGIRYIFPLHLNGDYLGSFEVTISMQSILGSIKTIFPANYQFLIKKSIVTNKAWEVNKSYILSDISNSYMYQKDILKNIDKSNIETIKDLNSKVKDELKVILSRDKPFSIFKKINDNYYQLTAIPIFNFENSSVAYILSYKEMDEMKFGERNFLIVNLIFTLFLSLLLFFIYKILQKNRNLIEAKNRALQAVKAREIFIANISHELRTPLNSIINFTDMVIEDFDEMLSDKELQEEYKFYLSRSLENSKHLLELINEILDFSRAEAGKIVYEIKKQNIVPIVINSSDNLKNLALQKGLKFIVDIEDRVIFANVDEKRLKQIITNLISNAIKFTENGFVKVHLKKEDKKVILRVIDSGKGIDEDKKEAIFNPFEQINSFDRGSGLGLSLVKSMCSSMNIKLSFKSTLNEGSTFILEFNKVD